MPTYLFECEKCDHTEEIVAHMSDVKGLRPTCPDCKQPLIRDFAAESVSVSEGPKTVGMLAQRNTEKLSSDERKYINDKNTEYLRKTPDKSLPEGMRYGKEILKEENR